MLYTYNLYVDQRRSPVTEATQAPPAVTMEQLFDAYGDAWASHDADAIAAYHADDGIFHLHAEADAVSGRDAIRETFAGFLAQWPDLTFTEQDRQIGDWGWVVRWTMSGTLAESGEVTEGAEAEAGASFSVDAVDVIEVRDGQLTAKHTYVDSQALLRQLGAAS
jgi:steroid delta-isomerase-like uncharacterized protein